MTKNDLDYIVRVLQGYKPVGDPNWWEISGFLQCHKIAGMFYTKAVASGLDLPSRIECVLRDIKERQKRKVRVMRNAIAELSEKLNGKNVPYAFLKGSVLCNVPIIGDYVYEDGERVSNDIDILARPEDLDGISTVLRESGYEQGVYDPNTGTVKSFTRAEILRRRMNRGEVAPFVKCTGDSEFPFTEADINFSLGNTPTDGAGLLKEMIRTSKMYNGKIDMRTLTPEMFFLHLVMHQYKESALYFATKRGKDLDLYKLADIYYLCVSENTNLPHIALIARAFGIEDRLGAVLRQVGEVFEDDAILKIAKSCGDVQPYVCDYENKKEYAWQSGIRDRICAFDATPYLREV